MATKTQRKPRTAATSEIKTVGSRAQVWHGTAKKTSGGLTKADLMMKDGRIISRKKHELAKKNNFLGKSGWIDLSKDAKDYAKKHGITLKEAIKIVSKSYKPKPQSRKTKSASRSRSKSRSS